MTRASSPPTCQSISKPMPASGFAGRGVGVGTCTGGTVSYPSCCSSDPRASVGVAGSQRRKSELSPWTTVERRKSIVAQLLGRTHVRLTIPRAHRIDT
jgi:hypothetical protein